ncbi:MAG: DNA repair exonuclease [Polyangia bacterium]
MKILLAGDLHIGRTSSRVPDSVSREPLRAASAWLRLVELAISEKVDLVCLSGDVVDRDNRFWEAIGPLRDGILRLAEAGARTVAVAGNHDCDVLPRLARQLPPESFTLLGRGGGWERIAIESQDGRPALYVDGWSFTEPRFAGDPLDLYDLPPSAGAPALGLLHGDLDNPSSGYAPLTSSRLRATGHAGWLLGHIHLPKLLESGPPWLLYPGSLQALDPGEVGAHGAWITRLERGSLSEPELRPLSSVRYESTTISLDGIETDSRIEEALLAGVRREGERCTGGSPYLRCLALRVALRGRTPLADRVEAVVQGAVEGLELPIDEAIACVERTEVDALPEIDLEAHAGSQAPPGALARLLLALESGEQGSELEDLVRRTVAAVEQVDRSSAFESLAREEIDERLARKLLAAQARKLLSQLVRPER